VSLLRLVVGVAVTIVWVLGYCMAYFVDKSYADLASSATPVMVPVITVLLGTEALKIIREGKPS
jgi:hypothetical protein